MADELRCRERGCGVVERLVLPSGYCFGHDPEKAGERLERSKKGGEATRRRFASPGISSEELGPLASVEDGQRWLVAIAQAVGDGRLTHGAAGAMTATVQAWLRSEDLRLRSTELARVVARMDEVDALESRTRPRYSRSRR